MSDKSFTELFDINVSADTRRAIYGGLAAAIIAVLGIWAVGFTSGRIARILLQATLPSLRFLCSAVMTSTASILALMLTLLSFSRSTDQRLASSHYTRVRHIALMACAVFIAALVLLLLLSIPVSEAENVPSNWYSTIYYIILSYAALLGGALIATVLMLYHAVRDIIGVVHPEKSSNLVESESGSHQD